MTGLTGEHLATGLDPVAANRASAVEFDPQTYAAVQRGTTLPTAFGRAPTVVLDPCYFDLEGSDSDVVGAVDWGAHDPGGPRQERPTGLHAEIKHRFGEYPATPFIYATPWASPERCAQMGSHLTAAVQVRTRIAEWLLRERLPDWQIAFIGVSEAHSASEGLFHGADPTHPLATMPSAPAAGEAIRSVYTAIDELVGDLVSAFPDAVAVVFAMHGMGPNRSDVPSMLLLGELMRRWSGDETPEVSFPLLGEGIPALGPNQTWSGAVKEALSTPGSMSPGLSGRLRRRLARTWTERTAPGQPAMGAFGPSDSGLSWMPLMRHQPAWPSMRAFAIPSFYDGRIRVNLRGREANGLVAIEDYAGVLDEIEAMIADCRDPVTGRPVVAGFERPVSEPASATPYEADLIIEWTGMPLGFVHDRLGTIGPFPPRRTGGHVSPWGACFVSGSGLSPADVGTRSSFDVIPTVFALAGVSPRAPISGDPIAVRADDR